jgi:uncharacterized alkaline shock family protein YloU
MHKDTSRTDFGTVKIHNNVIASIASLAAMEIEGVKRIGGDFRTGIMQLVVSKSLVAIRVEIDKNEEVKLQVPLIIKYDYNIPEVAHRAQENIRAALERMTHLSVKDINITIQGIERG